MKKLPALSIVTTSYFSEKHIEKFVLEMSKCAEELCTNFEIICVDDGSEDKTKSILKTVKKRVPELKIVELSRNFGHHPALITGLSIAKNEYIFVIDSDLEEEPNWLSLFWRQMNIENADAVYGVQKTRKKSAIVRIFSRIFYWLASFNSKVKVQTDSTTARLMTRDFLDAILLLNDRVFAIGELWPSVGFKQSGVKVNKKYKGSTSYTFLGRLENALNYFISGSYIPILPLIILCGVFLALTFFMLAYVLFSYFYTSTLVGWPSLVIIIMIFGTANFLMLTVTLAILTTILKEVKGRPISIIKRIL